MSGTMEKYFMDQIDQIMIDGSDKVKIAKLKNLKRNQKVLFSKLFGDKPIDQILADLKPEEAKVSYATKLTKEQVENNTCKATNKHLVELSSQIKESQELTSSKKKKMIGKLMENHPDVKIKLESLDNEIKPTVVGNGSAKKVKQFGMELRSFQGIPPVLNQCFDYFLNGTRSTRALETEGIFRLSANCKLLEASMKKFDEGEIVELEKQPILVAALIKKFFCLLPEPLFPFDACKAILKLPDKQVEYLFGNVRKILNQLPTQNYVILKQLVRVLDAVIGKSEKNKMSAENLAICFAPNLVKSKSNQVSVDENNAALFFVKYLLENRRKLMEF